eukprot:1880233-Prymnesium_polylepis.2
MHETQRRPALYTANPHGGRPHEYRPRRSRAAGLDHILFFDLDTSERSWRSYCAGVMLLFYRTGHAKNGPTRPRLGPEPS